MKIKAVKFFENGFMTQPFALGGEDGMDKFDASVRYRSCLQNYVIDTGSEVILVDTGLPKDFPAPAAHSSRLAQILAFGKAASLPVWSACLCVMRIFETCSGL